MTGEMPRRIGETRPPSLRAKRSNPVSQQKDSGLLRRLRSSQWRRGSI